MRFERLIVGAALAVGLVALPLAARTGAGASTASATPSARQGQSASAPTTVHFTARFAGHGYRFPGRAYNQAGWGAGFARWGGMRAGGFQRGGPLMLDRIARNPEMRQRLGLSDAQARQIESATLEFQKARITNRAQEQIGRLQLRDLLTASQPDEAAIDQQLNSLNALRLTQQKAAIHYRLTMRSALTPAQQQTLRQMMRPRMRGPMRRGFGPGQMHRGPAAPSAPPATTGPGGANPSGR